MSELPPSPATATITAAADVIEHAGRLAFAGAVGTAEAVMREACLATAVALTATRAQLAFIFRAAGQVEVAREESERAMASWDAARATGDPNPLAPQLVELIVAVLVDAGKTAEALEVAQAAVANGDDPRAIAAVGRALNAEGREEEAVAALLRSSASWLAAGALLRAQVDADAAAAVSGPTPEILLAIARARAAMTDEPGARESYEEAVAADPTLRSPGLEAELARLAGAPDKALALADTRLVEAPGDEEALAARAQTLHGLGRHLEAIAALDLLVEKRSGDRFRLMRASLRAWVGDSDGALADLNGLGPVTSREPLVALIRAELQLTAGRHDEALAWFDQALAGDPGNGIAKAERTLALFQMGRQEEAESEVEALMADPPQDMAVAEWKTRQPPLVLSTMTGVLHAVRGRLRLASEEYQNARADLTAALDILGHRPDTTALLARALLADGDAQAGLDVVNQAPTVMGGVPDLLAVKAEALRQLNRLQDALTAIDHAVDAQPTNLDYRQLKALILFEQDRYQEVIVEVEDLARHSPGNTLVLYMWGSALANLGRHEEALGLLAEAERFGAGPEVFIDHATLLVQLDRSDEAVRVAQDAVSRFPGDASVFALLGRVLADKEDFEASAEALRRSWDIDPDQSGLAAELGDALYRLGEYDKALTWLNRTLEAEPESFFALGTKGQVLRASGDEVGGMDLLRQAARLSGDDIPGWVVDELVTALGDHGTNEALQEALSYLDRFLAREPGAAWALAAQAETLRLLDRPADGLEAADAALRADEDMGRPESPGTLGTKAHLLLDLLRHEEALELADRLVAAAAAEQRENLFARSARIRALLALDRHAEALAELAHYLEVSPGDEWALFVKADALADYRDFAAALAILEQLPVRSYHDGLIGFCRKRLGDLARAAVALEAAVAADSQVWWWWAELGETRWMLDDRVRAREAFQVLIEAAGASTSPDLDLLLSAAWAAFRHEGTTGAVSFAQQAVTLAPTEPEARFQLANILLLSGHGLAALDEFEAAAALAADRPDPRRAAAIIEGTLSNLEELDGEGALDDQRAEADEARRILRDALAGLPQRHPAIAT